MGIRTEIWQTYAVNTGSLVTTQSNNIYLHACIYTYFALEILSIHSSLSFSVCAQKKYCLAATLSVHTVNPPCRDEGELATFVVCRKPCACWK